MKEIVSAISINQNKIIKDIQAIDKKIVFLKSTPLTSKTTILKKIFDKGDFSEKIFITGCNPKYMIYINELLVNQIESIIKNIGKKKLLICLDEYYNEIMLDYLTGIAIKYNVLIVITTNNLNIKRNENTEFINIYPLIYENIVNKVYKKYSINLSNKIKKETLSLKELKLLIEYKKRNTNISIEDKRSIKKVLKKENEKRNEPYMTSLLYVGSNIDMLVNYNCDKLRS